MRKLAFKGVRGGVGTTSIVAALAQTLADNQQRVLVVDLCPTNMLGLHFQLAGDEPSGWAYAQMGEGAWQEHAWQLTPTLTLLPYGDVSAQQVAALELYLQQHPTFWSERVEALNQPFDWLLFDVPYHLSGHQHLGEAVHWVDVAQPDAACHVLLNRLTRPVEHLLVNRFDAAKTLPRDLLLLWQAQFPQLLSVRVHEDAAMEEALASKMPVTRYAEKNLVSQDIKRLATWCLTQLRAPEECP